MEWKCQRMKQLETGITIKSGIWVGDSIILGDDGGQIYKIGIKEEEKVSKEIKN